MRKLLSLLTFLYAFQAYGQNYDVTFAGTGESVSVTTVIVENLTTGEKLQLNGTDVLRLTLPTSVNNAEGSEGSGLRFFPNPMTEYSVLEVISPVAGEASVSILDLSGKLIISKTIFFNNATRVLRLSGLGNGLYIVDIKGSNYRMSGKLLCTASQTGTPDIKLMSTSGIASGEEKELTEEKGISTIVDMPYNQGEIIKFLGVSGDFSTVATSVFTSGKLISFKFVRCQDGDNRNYPVVEIGSQIWMAVNLRSKTYSNGELIGTTDPATLNITSLTNPKYEWVYNGYQIVVDTALIGRLYSWHAAVDNRKLCPTGWHLPQQSEWNTLFTSIGGANVAGGKLKESGLTHWSTPNTGATNESGFTALPNGSRSPSGSFINLKTFCYLWSATERDNTYAWYCGLTYNGATGYTDINTAKSVGLGVRCIKD